jgi:heptosyltransferase-2
MSAAERIVVIQPGALGDLVQAFPAMGRIRAAFPAAHLALLVGTPFAGVARASGLFDEVIAFDLEATYHGGMLARLRVAARVTARLRRLAPSRVAVFKGAPVYAFFAWASGAVVRVGLTRGAGARFLTTPIAVDPERHREDRYFDVARALGAAGEATVAARWDGAGGESLLPARTGPRIGMVPGGARNVKEEMPERRWATERYAELAARVVAAHPDASIVLLGGPGDRNEAEGVTRALPPGSVVDLVGRTSIAQAHEVISSLDAVVLHDSGLLHIAGATSTPVVAVFGPTDPGVVVARRPDVTALWRPSFATPCHDEVTGAVRCAAEGCCIDRVGVDEVWEALSRVLAREAMRVRG